MGAYRYFDDGDGRVIYCGDWREVLPQLTFDVIVTDPPYGTMDVHANGKQYGDKLAKCGRNVTYKPCVENNVAPSYAELAAFEKRVIAFGAEHFADGLPSGGRFWVWDKRTGMPSNNWGDCEVAWDSKPGPNRIIYHRCAGMLHDGYGDIGKKHPFQKPTAVMKTLLLDTRGTVVDPYAGVGSTLRACKDIGRSCIGVEIDEEYCEAAANRLRQRTLEFVG